MPFFYYKLKVQYNGYNYYGWQEQADELPTVQYLIKVALRKMIGCHLDQIKLVGSGRTDRGVHALGQIVKVVIPSPLPPKALIHGVNAHLPKKIRVLEAEECLAEYNPIRGSKWKEYCYVWHTSPSNPFQNQLMTHCPYPIDFIKIQKAANLFVGTHDFANFFCTGTPVKTSVRTIYHCSVHEERPSGLLSYLFPNYFVFRVIGNGFLKQMVRLMVGALWAVGTGKITESKLQDALSLKHQGKLSVVVPPQGLYLREVGSTPFDSSVVFQYNGSFTDLQ